MKSKPNNEISNEEIDMAINEQTSPSTSINNIKITTTDLVFITISILQRVLALCFNIYVAYDYYNSEKSNYFVWTICCIVFPLIITTILYLNMFFQDQLSATKYQKINCIEIIIYIIILPIIFRYCKSFYYAIKSKISECNKNLNDQRLYYKLMIKEESDLALVRLFECFLDAAPQKILQISIIIAMINNNNNNQIHWSQFGSIFGCLISLSWSMVTYNKYIRYAQSDKELLTLKACICQTLWHFFITLSRILCISMLSCLFPLWTILSFLIHALISAIILILYDKLEICNDKLCCSIGFCLILGIVYIFVYIMPKDNCNTKIRYIIYYIICIIENLIAALIFFVYATERIKEYYLFIPICILSNVLYIFGILIMIVYYLYFHPKAKCQLSLRLS